MARKMGLPCRGRTCDNVVTTVHAYGVKLPSVLPPSGVLYLGLIDQPLWHLECRETAAKRLDASCVRPQRQEIHNVLRSIYRSSFAGLGLIRIVLLRSECTFFPHVGF